MRVKESANQLQLLDFNNEHEVMTWQSHEACPELYSFICVVGKLRFKLMWFFFSSAKTCPVLRVAIVMTKLSLVNINPWFLSETSVNGKIVVLERVQLCSKPSK